MTLAKTLEGQLEKINAVDKVLGNCNLCKRLSKEEKFKIIFKLNNMNPSVFIPFFDKVARRYRYGRGYSQNMVITLFYWRYFSTTMLFFMNDISKQQRRL